ncbi:hypothetical protein K456DRAFT_42717 [Colletotrichum gloeosporioides 23]|nr:hypothetical protein K456DRAFT_42717 [Colletotrichum gloeosporioides 23]
MLSARQILVYGIIFSSATIIGYDSGYLNGVLGSQDFTKIYGIRDGDTGAMYLTPYTRSTFSALFVVGALVGCQLVPLLTSKIGRRGNLYAASCTYAVGVALQTAGLAPAVFIVGRVLLGVAFGLISVTVWPLHPSHVYTEPLNDMHQVPAYLMECSTPTNRGQLMARYSQFLTTGNVLACAISLGTSKYADSRSWRITIAFQLVLALTVIGGGVLMGLAQLLTAIIHTAAPDSKADKTMLVVGAVFFIASYAPTWGIGGWLLMAEPFSDRARNYQSSIVLTAYWIITWLVGFVTLYMVDETAGNLGVKVSYIWFSMTVLSLVWAYTCVPELAGLSRSEIDKLFEERVPAWRSREWQRQLRTIQAVEAESDKGPTVEEKMPCKE